MRSYLAVIGLVLALTVGAPSAWGDVIVYDATIQIDWYNNYLGARTNIENDATVTVDYLAPGVFEIIALTFSEPVSGVGTMTLGEAGISSGTISGGVATGTLGYSGVLGPYSISNVNGPYSGTASMGGRFTAGDVYALTQYWAGTAAGVGNWDHRSPDTKIIFGVPEPASLVLLGLASAMLLRKRTF